MASSAFCCTHPRLFTPEPPSRRPGAGSIASLDGLLAAASLPEDHPHALRFVETLRRQRDEDTAASTDIVASPGFRGRLRMKLTSRKQFPRRRHSLGVFPRGRDLEGSGNMWEMVGRKGDEGSLTGLNAVVRDALMLSDEDIFRQVQQESCGEENAMTPDEAIRNSSGTIIEDAAFGQTLVSALRTPLTSCSNGVDQIASFNGRPSPPHTLPPTSTTSTDRSQKSFRQDSGLAGLANCQFDGTHDNLPHLALPSPHASIPRRSCSADSTTSTSSTMLSDSPRLLEYSTSLAMLATRQHSSAISIVDDTVVVVPAPAPRSAAMRIRRKSSTSFDLQSMISRHTKQAGDTTTTAGAARAVEVVGGDDDAVVVARLLPSPHIREKSMTETTDDEPFCPSQLSLGPSSDVVPVPLDGASDPLVLSPTTHASSVHLQHMQISRRLRATSRRSLPTSVDGDVGVPGAELWNFHHRERGGVASSSLDLEANHEDRTLNSNTQSQLFGDVTLPRTRVTSPQLDASSSVYSRSCSAQDDHRGRVSPGEKMHHLNACLASWPLADHGRDARADDGVVLGGIADPKDEDRRRKEGETADISVGGHAHSPIARSSVGPRSAHAIKKTASTPTIIPLPSKSSLSSLSRASNNNKKSKFLEAFTPPKKAVKKRRSIFRFLRPGGGGGKQMRSLSTPVLRSSARQNGRGTDGAAADAADGQDDDDDDLLTVRYELTEAGSRSMVEASPSLLGDCKASLKTTATESPATATGVTKSRSNSTTQSPTEAHETTQSIPRVDIDRLNIPTSATSRRASAAHLTADQVSNDESVSRKTSASWLSPTSNLSRKGSGSAVSSQPCPSPALTGERRQTLAEYERSLTLTGDDRRRPSVINLQRLQEIQEEERRESSSVRRKLSRAYSNGKDDEDASPLMASALRRHQQEKAMFRSEGKRRESLSVSQSSPMLMNVVAPRHRSFDRSVSANALEIESLAKRYPESTTTQAGQTLQVPLDKFGFHPHRPRLASTVASERSFPVATPDDAPRSSPPSATRIGTSFASWSRFPSHTRSDRSGPADASDNVKTRDFALPPSNSSSSPSTTASKKQPAIDSPASKISAKSSASSSIRASLIKSRSMTFGGIVRYYHSLVNTGTGFTGQNRRTSVAVSGKLSHPELEMIPPVAPPGAEGNSSTHKHLREVERHILLADDKWGLRHAPHHHHIEQDQSALTGSQQQQPSRQFTPMIEFRAGSMFAGPSRKSAPRDSVVDGYFSPASPKSARVPSSSDSNAASSSSSDVDPVVSSRTITTTKTTTQPEPIVQLDGPGPCDIDDDIGGPKDTTVVADSASRAEAWSHVYQSCMARHVPSLSVGSASEHQNNVNPTKTHNACAPDTDETTLLFPPPAMLKPIKSRSSPEATTSSSIHPKSRLDPNDANVRIRRFPSVTVVDDQKGHLRSVSLISAQSLRSNKSAGAIQRNSTYDLIQFIQAKELEEKEKLMGMGDRGKRME